MPCLCVKADVSFWNENKYLELGIVLGGALTVFAFSDAEDKLTDRDRLGLYQCAVAGRPCAPQPRH